MDNLESAFSPWAVMLQHDTLHAGYQQVRTGYMLSTIRSQKVSLFLFCYDILVFIVLPSSGQNPVSSVSIVTRLHLTRPSGRSSVPN
jgi:hypothetical protein